MGACESGAQARRSVVDEDTNRKISKDLRELAVKNASIQKLLLLGAGESGKSTIFKQLKIVHDRGFEPADRSHYAHVIHSNIIDSIETLVNFVVDHLRCTGSLPSSKSSGLPSGQLQLEQILLNAFSSFGSGNYQSAIRDFTLAINECENRDKSQLHMIFTGRAATYTALKMFNLALKDASAALDFKKDYVKAMLHRGIALAGMKRYPQAVESLQKALQLEPNNKTIMSYLQQVETVLVESRKLPEGWEEHVDKDGGQPYFHNTATGETTWKRPRIQITEPDFDVTKVSDTLDQPHLSFSTEMPIASEDEPSRPFAGLERRDTRVEIEDLSSFWLQTISTTNDLRRISNGRPFLDPASSQQLLKIWKHPTIAKVFADRHRHRLDVMDSISYFMSEIGRIGQLNFNADNQDIVMSRVRTTGITEMQFQFGKAAFRITDVGGQRSERRKWLHLFDHVQAVIFVVAMNEYDQTLFEDSTRNRLLESLDLFEQICNSKWLTDTPMILFLNKRDLFAEKIQTVDMKCLFPDYTGGFNFDAGRIYLTNQFAKRCHFQKDIFVHVTCATDTTNIEFVFEAVKDIVLQKNVRAAGF
eukprot:c7925_g1_i3.p1 GENE.c7925_g1_i3~~c7925_g1_i3.p1  ORF type:complete len:588 (-),score=117.15 c7925_g1_i3:62-1825(-)